MAADLTTQLWKWAQAIYGSVGTGSPVIVAQSRSTAQTAAVASVASYTPAVDMSLIVSGNVLVTATSGTTSFALQVDFTDEGNTARTYTLMLNIAASTTTNSVTNAQGTVAYAGYPMQIRAKGGTAVTIKTAGASFSTVTYNVEGVIMRVA